MSATKFKPLPADGVVYSTAAYMDAFGATFAIHGLKETNRVEIVRITDDTQQKFCIDAETARALGRELIAASRALAQQKEVA